MTRSASLWFLIVFVVFPGIAGKPCEYSMSVNISHGVRFANGSVLADGIMYPENLTYKDKTDGLVHLRGCPCKLRTCMRKCCPLGQAYENDKDCVDSDDPKANPFNPTIYDMDVATNVEAHGKFAFLENLVCQSYVMNPYSGSDMADYDKFYLQNDGRIYTPSGGENLFVEIDQFCMEAWLSPPLDHNTTNWTTQYLVKNCFEDTEKQVYFGIGMCLSVPFLILTFLVYAIVPELRNLHGKSLMCYVFGLTVAYIVLINLQFQNIPTSDWACMTLAFILYLSFMVSFFWLNVMCFDIWWTFSNMRAHRGGRKASEKRRFIYYSIYAWGFPILMTCICALMQFHPDIPDHHTRPGFSSLKCWFDSAKATSRYFYVPMMILMVCNMVLFSITAFKIFKIKQETAVLQNSDSCRHSQLDKDKQRFNLYFKLFLVMGINWMMEWISFVVKGSDYIWYVSDFLNSIVGVFIFMLFVWKKKVKNLLLKRYRLLRYGSTVARTRDSSRYRSGHATSTTDPVTERSIMSEENGIKMSSIK